MTHLLALLGLAFGLGLLARRSARFPAGTPAALNAFLLNVALPALVIRAVHALELTPALAGVALAPWLLFLGAWALFALAARPLGLAPETRACLVLTAGLGNTAFVGLPLTEALLGPGALPVAVVADQLGSFLTLVTLGAYVASHGAAARHGAGPVRWGDVALRVLTFPPFLALVVAVLSRPFALPGWLDAALARFGALLTPLALFSVGFSLRLGGVGARARALALGLGYKLVLGPALGAALLWALRVPPPVMAPAVLQLAMAPMVSAALLAAEHDLDAELGTLMVGLGLPLSFAAAFAWMALLAP